MTPLYTVNSWLTLFAMLALPWQEEYRNVPGHLRDAAHIAVGQLLGAVNVH